ncbi:MAG TPA: hypothetical protein VGO80_04765 [Solirubrobacteraceae bacterium]|jgi:hypothetical protein|nr:hypothetical protein [Solirubrobacteraceae bacterium]
MPGRSAHLAVILALTLAACGSSEPAAVPLACAGEPSSIVRALDAAPGAVALSDGTRLSRCVRLAAHRDGDMQSLGLALTRAVDGLRDAAAADPVAALRLGYLVGAVRRGAAQTPGLAAQLARRLEQLASFGIVADAPLLELRRGIRLGEARG